MAADERELPGDERARSERIWHQRLTDQRTAAQLRAARLERTVAALEQQVARLTAARSYRLSKALRDHRGIRRLPSLARAVVAVLKNPALAAVPERIADERIQQLEADDRLGRVHAARRELEQDNLEAARSIVAELLAEFPFHFDALRLEFDIAHKLDDLAAAAEALSRMRFMRDDFDLRSLGARLGQHELEPSLKARPWAEIHGLSPAPAGRLLVFPPSPKNDFYDILYTGLNHMGVDTLVPDRWDRGNVQVATAQPDTAVHLHWTGWLNEQAGGPGVDAFLHAIGEAPLVWTVHNTVPHDEAEPATVRRRLAAAAKIVHLMHEPDADGLLDLELDPARVVRIPLPSYRGVHPAPPPKTAARVRLNLSWDDFVVAVPGRLRSYRGLALIAEAAHQVPSDVRFLVAGEPAPDADTLAMLARLQQEGRCRVIPRFLSPAEMVTAVAAADVVALPYRQVLNSGALMVALTVGRAVVVPDVEVFAWLTRRDLAELFTPGDASSLARAIGRSRRFADDANLLARIDDAIAPRHPTVVSVAFAREMAERLGWKPPLNWR